MNEINSSEQKETDMEDFLGSFGIRAEEMITIANAYDLDKMEISDTQMKEFESLMGRLSRATSALLRRSMEARMSEYSQKKLGLRDKIQGLQTNVESGEKIVEKMAEVLGKMGVNVRLIPFGVDEEEPDDEEDASDDTEIHVDKHQAYAFVEGKSTILFAYSPNEKVMISESAALLTSHLMSKANKDADSEQIPVTLSDGTTSKEFVFDNTVVVYGDLESEPLMLLPKEWFDTCGLKHGNLDEWKIEVL